MENAPRMRISDAEWQPVLKAYFTEHPGVFGRPTTYVFNLHILLMIDSTFAAVA
jgi:hypothetical protein